MPAFEMTPAEEAKYGAGLSIWESLVLIQAWAPLLTFAKRFIGTPDPFAKAVMVSEACELLASKTNSGLDDDLVKHLAGLLKTKEGEDLVRWVVAKAQGLQA